MITPAAAVVSKRGASITIKSRPLVGGGVSWGIWIRRPRPEKDELIPLPEFTTLADRPAVEVRLALYRKALRKGLSEPLEESCTQFFDRFLTHREAIGKVRRGRDLESSWSTWIAPKIGTKPIAGLSRENVEDVRDALDVEVAKRKKEGSPAGLSGARARNVWSVLTSMMKEACTSKRRDLRVRADNPCTNVQPPDKTDARAKTFIYPSEFLTLASCAAIPREWRETYAVACYLYLRPGELRALLWTDIDLEAGAVHVTKAYDEDSGAVKAPKTRAGVRDVPLPANLVPLLEAMQKRATDTHVLPLMQECSERRRAAKMRKHFTIAKIQRARLTEQSATTMQINFRSCRDTGITWLALQGVDLAKMQRRAGHERIETTSGYVKAAEDLTGSIGEPFPRLPEELVGTQIAACTPPVPCTPSDPLDTRNHSVIPDPIAERAGVEPAVRF